MWRPGANRIAGAASTSHFSHSVTLSPGLVWPLSPLSSCASNDRTTECMFAAYPDAHVSRVFDDLKAWGTQRRPGERIENNGKGKGKGKGKATSALAAPSPNHRRRRLTKSQKTEASTIKYTMGLSNACSLRLSRIWSQYMPRKFYSVYLLCSVNSHKSP